jgi:hypothetical protein
MEQSKIRSWRAHRPGIDGPLAGESASEVLQHGMTPQRMTDSGPRTCVEALLPGTPSPDWDGVWKAPHRCEKCLRAEWIDRLERVRDGSSACARKVARNRERTDGSRMVIAEPS